MAELIRTGDCLLQKPESFDDFGAKGHVFMHGGVTLSVSAKRGQGNRTLDKSEW
jgi:hypothetical protein